MSERVGVLQCMGAIVETAGAGDANEWRGGALLVRDGVRRVVVLEGMRFAHTGFT